MYYSNQARIIFIRVPKAGSTSILAALKERFPDLQAFDPSNPYKLYRQIELPEAFETFFRFAVLRHPVEWLRSMFDSLRRGEGMPCAFLRPPEMVHDIGTFARRLRKTPCDWIAPGPNRPIDRVFVIEKSHELEEHFDIHLNRLNQTLNPHRQVKFTPTDKRYLSKRFRREFEFYGALYGGHASSN